MQQYNPPPPPNPYAPYPVPKNGQAVAGMVLGILSVIGWWAGIGELALVVLAITLGAVGMRRASGPGGMGAGHGQAVAGLVLGIAGALAYLCFAIATAGIGFVI